MVQTSLNLRCDGDTAQGTFSSGWWSSCPCRGRYFNPDSFGWWMKPRKSQAAGSAWGLPLRLAEIVVSAGGVVVVKTCVTKWSSSRRKSAG